MKNRHPSRWIFLLLALLLVISLSLAWQSLVSVSSHRQTVDAVLADYAELMLDDFIRSTHRYVGYDTLWTAKAGLEESGLMAAELPTWSADQLKKALHEVKLPPGWIKSVFRIGRDHAATVEWLFGSPDRRLAQRMASALQTANEPFRVYHFRQEGHTGIQAALKDPSLQTVILVMDPLIHAKLFTTVFDRAGLLPASLTTSPDLKSHVWISVQEPGGGVVFEKGNKIDYAVQATRIMDESYSGLFAGFRVTMQVDPGLAESLALGRPPLQSMVWVAVLLATSLILVTTTVLLIRRERQLMAMRTEFIARVSHELRTPLTQIRMFTESILLDRLPGPAEQRRALGIINRETLRLSRLVENILSFSSRNGTVLPSEAKDYSLAGLLHRIREEFAPLLKAADMQLEIRCDDELMVDYNRDALSQVLTNLLDNAIKYGPAGQTIRIRAGVTASELAVAVTDEGPGIPAREQQRIWNAYYRLDREQGRGIAGTGIGLAVARELAAGLGAALELVSHDTGSTFTLKFETKGDAHG